MVWKKILHGTQTGVSPYKPGSLVWKKIKLHGTQTQGVFIIKKCWAWKKIKLHGTQIPPRYALPVTGLVEGKITWYSNTDFPGCLAE